MPVAIFMPALSPTMKKGNLSRWLKKEGDVIKSGDVIAEIETDKATMEVETVEDGFIGKILIEEGTADVAVNAPIAVVLFKNDKKEQVDDFIKTLSIGLVVPTLENAPKKEVSEIKAQTVAVNNTDRVIATPLARRVAQQNNIDLQTIKGTGPKGRIIKADLENISSSYSGGEGSDIIPMTTMRRVIADRLTLAKRTIPHFYLSMDIKTDQLALIRKTVNSKFPDGKVTVNDLVVKATALALMDVPAMNATFHGDHIERFRQADVCVAVSIEGGLITPILKRADQKSIMTISQEIKALAMRAKENKLRSEEFTGGSFTVSNLGMYGIKQFEAIINPPQVGILAVGGIQDNGFMTVSLSCDHRAVDGADGALFLLKLKQYLENPMLMLL